MDEQTQAEIAAIEELVLARRLKPAREAIPTLLRKHGARDRFLVFRACDWYRRLGLFAAAYRLLDLKESWVRATPTTELDRQRMIWAVRMLNAMGAAELTRGMLDAVDPRTADEHRVVGEIRLARFEHALAARHFERMGELDTEPASYRSRLARINFADALNGVGLVDRAIEQASAVARVSPEPLLQGIALQARGEYLARAGKLAEAQAALKEAAARFPADDESPDMALLLKWKGYVEARLGSRENGLKEMEHAIRIFRAAGAGPEAWLDVYRLQSEAGLLAPALLERARGYPGLAAPFRAMFPKPSAQGASAHVKARLRIDLGRGETTLARKLYLGIPLELRALAYLRRAEDWGVPLVKLKSLLWPDQAHAFLQLEGRLQQLFKRLRQEHGMEIEVTRGVARLERLAFGRVAMLGHEWAPGKPSFLERRQRFTRADLERHYELSRSHACNWLARWEAEGWVRRTGTGKKATYERIATESR